MRRLWKVQDRLQQGRGRPTAFIAPGWKATRLQGARAEVQGELALALAQGPLPSGKCFVGGSEDLGPCGFKHRRVVRSRSGRRGFGGDEARAEEVWEVEDDVAHADLLLWRRVGVGERRREEEGERAEGGEARGRGAGAEHGEVCWVEVASGRLTASERVGGEAVQEGGRNESGFLTRRLTEDVYTKDVYRKRESAEGRLGGSAGDVYVTCGWEGRRGKKSCTDKKSRSNSVALHLQDA